MKNLSRLLILLPLAGCNTIAHELQPHRLWRWNYQEAPSRTDDALFSIDDPAIPLVAEETNEKSSAENE